MSTILAPESIRARVVPPDLNVVPVVRRLIDAPLLTRIDLRRTSPLHIADLIASERLAFLAVDDVVLVDGGVFDPSIPRNPSDLVHILILDGIHHGHTGWVPRSWLAEA